MKDIVSPEEISKIIDPKDEMMAFFKNIGKSEKDYFDSGYIHSRSFIESITKHRPTFLQNKTILDYGCGHGRIIRFISKNLSPEKLIAADVWESAIKFCADEFNTIPFFISKNNQISDLGIKYDIILSYSVFTHLPLESFKENLLDLKNSLKKDGILLFTTHGKYHSNLHKLSLTNGFHFGSLGKSPNHTDGRLSGEEYSFMCVTKEFVEKVLAEVGLKLLDHIQNVTKFSGQEMYVTELK